MGRPKSLGEDLEAGLEEEQVSRSKNDWPAVFVCIIVAWVLVGSFLMHLVDISFAGLVVSPLMSEAHPAPIYAFSTSKTTLPKPTGFNIVALISVRHPERTSILDCYLQRNLVRHGGFLDNVVFIPETTDSEHLDWLESSVNATVAYSMENFENLKFSAHDLYINIDGDVVYLEDTAIPTIVKTIMDNPDTVAVSANVIHQPATASLPLHEDVTLPYLPELHRREPELGRKAELSLSWRASRLPTWDGPGSFRVQKGFRPPFAGHRWLPSLPPDDRYMDQSPAAAERTETGPEWDSWTTHAQQHYSFLHHLERGRLRRYKFPIWRNPTAEISDAFFCARGADMGMLARQGAFPEFGKQTIVDGKGVVSHYDHQAGLEGLDMTDLLKRYRAYAEEVVCPGIDSFI